VKDRDAKPLRADRRRIRWCEAIGHHHWRTAQDPEVVAGRASQFECVLCGCSTCEDDL